MQGTHFLDLYGILVVSFNLIMKSIRVLLFVMLLGAYLTNNAQTSPVDNSWLKFTYGSNGSRTTSAGNDDIDIRTTGLVLDSGTTFSFRPDGSYYPMANFNSQNYTQGYLRTTGGAFKMNYRLLFPKNYASNPNFSDGYPLIVMTHGLGEVGNCTLPTGGSCYFANQNWDPARNNVDVRNFIPKIYNITSATKVSNSSVRFTTSENHYFVSGSSNTITIADSNVPEYNGTWNITAVTTNTITANVTWRTTTLTTATAKGNVFTLPGGELLNVMATNEIVMIRGNASTYNGIRRLIKLEPTPNNPTHKLFRLSTSYAANGSATSNLVLNNASFTNGTIERFVGKVYSITGATNIGGGITEFTTSEDHQFVVGGPMTSNQVKISNSTEASYNGTYTVTATPTARTFRVSVPYNGNTTALAARPLTVHQLLNNDHSMVHGGAVHQNAVNAVPTGMTPDDLAMPSRAFPGFVLFGQNLNTWSHYRKDYNNIIIIIRLLIEKYNIDPNRIYVHGLSDGGSGAYRLIRNAPWLFAGALPMSAVDDADIRDWGLIQYVRTVPIWTFQGGTDGNPTPNETKGYVQSYLNNGMSARYTVYPNLGHGTWNTAYAEPDFFSWMTSKNKSDILTRFGKTEICATNGQGVIMELAQGFHAYQWEKDSVIIEGEGTYTYTALLPGIYRARFSRIPNPTENDWNRWSKPVTITESTPEKPVISTNGTLVYSNPINNTNDGTYTFKSSKKAHKYHWSRTPAFNQSPLDTVSTLNLASFGNFGVYTLVTEDISGCPSPPSDPVYAFRSAGDFNITIPSNFTGQVQSPTSIFLKWNDNSANEKGFEIWRRKSGETLYQFISRTPEDAISYLDTGLESATTYQYKIRAVGNAGRSYHVPFVNQWNEPQNPLTVGPTPGDTTPPSAPQNLRVVSNDASSISIAWDASTDNTGVKQYLINLIIDSNPVTIETLSDATSYQINGLEVNTTYPITVQAQDHQNNVSQNSNQILGNTYVQGLFYGHSTGAWSFIDPNLSAGAEDTPPMQWYTFEYYGNIPNFDVRPHTEGGVATQTDFYNFKFDGYLDIPTNTSPLTQIYQFRINSDDGSMLFLNGFNPGDLTTNLYVNNDGLHGPQWRPVADPDSQWDVTLTPGPHRIVVLFFERTGGNTLEVQYRIKNGVSSYTGWTAIPNSMLRSGVYTPPAVPNAPINLAANATGMTSIDLNWNYGTGSNSPDEFEVYRSTELNGIYAMLARTAALTYTDNTGLIPGTTYYYKLKTVNENGSSDFSTVDSDQTFPDAIAPSVPSFLTLASKTYTNVAFTWTASTDNVGVTGYEILIDGVVTDTTASTSYMAMNLNPGTLYNFTVKAFDASHNKSAPSDALVVTTNMGQVFYSKDEGNLSSSSTWGTETDGSGSAPNFNLNGQIYQINNRTTADVGGSLTIQGTASKLIVPTGVTLVVDQPLSAKLELQGNAVVQLDAATTPEFISVSDNSTIHFNGTNAIPARQFGNVVLMGSGNKNFAAGETIIRGDLTVSGPVALKGAPGNTSKLTLHGNLEMYDTPGLLAADNTLDLTLANPTSQSLTLPGSIDFYRITTQPNATVTLVNSFDPVTLNVGSAQGGGLVLANGSTLNLGNNHLSLKIAGAINPANQTGRVAINNSNLSLASSSTQNSNLYLDATQRTAGLVTSNFSGSGKLNIQSPLIITDGLKVSAGELNAGAGNVTLVSNQTKTAYLQEIEGNGSVTGQVNVQRWISAARKYRYMASPVENLTVAAVQGNQPINMPVTGPFIGANTNATAASMFKYDEPSGGYSAYPDSTNTEMFEKGRGYSIFNFNGNNPLTLTTLGTPYQGNWSYTLTPGTGIPANNDGWNLIGNPYASAIQWNNVAGNWTRTGVSPIVYVPDNTSGTLVYRTYDAATGVGGVDGTATLANGIIAPGQAFWVQTINASPTLTITEKAKRTNTSTFYREAAPVSMFTVFLNSSTAQDPAYVILGDQYSDAFEPAADGRKKKNDVLNLSTRSSDNTELVFNKLTDSFCQKQIGLTVENVTPGNYSLTFANISNLLGIGEIILTDNFTQTTKVVNDSEAYAFAVTSNTASYGANRFTLSIARPALQKTAAVSAANLCGGTHATVQLTNTQPGAFYYASLPGITTAVSTEVTSSGGAITLNIPVANLQAGVNAFEIHTGFKGCSNELLQAAPVSITYTPAPEIRVYEPYYSVCQGTAVTLQAETNGNNTIAWYRNGTLVAQGNSQLNTDFLKETTVFEVAAITANGCESGRMPITIEVENVAVPVVAYDGYALTLTEPVNENTFVQWYKNDEPLEVYTPYIEPADEGYYSILVSRNGCSKVSDPFSFVVTAVEEDTDAVKGMAAYVYPNPASPDQLYMNLEVTAQQDVEVTMNDLTGRPVYNQWFARNQANGIHRINIIGDIAPGLYIITIQQGEAVLKRKVIITFR